MEPLITPTTPRPFWYSLAVAGIGFVGVIGTQVYSKEFVKYEPQTVIEYAQAKRQLKSHVTLDEALKNPNMIQEAEKLQYRVSHLENLPEVKAYHEKKESLDDFLWIFTGVLGLGAVGALAYSGRKEQANPLSFYP